MRVLVLYAHPCEDSFNAALHARVVATLAAAGHEVDDCDLYAEDFQPVLTRDERKAYHDVSVNRSMVSPHVARVMAAEALVLVSPVWNFGFPAILKGFFDRVFLPGVAFRMEGAEYRPCLHNIRTLVAVMTYGGDRARAFLAGDPPRRIVTRVLRAVIRPGAAVEHLALYDMNHATPSRCGAFLDRVEARMKKFD